MSPSNNHYLAERLINMSIFSKINSDELLKENISEQITDLLESISNTESIINSYMIESSIIINESVMIRNIQSIIKKLIDFVKELYEKFMSLFMTQADYINYILDKNSMKFHELSDEKLKTIVYEYKEFKVDINVPIFGYFNNVQKYVDKLSSFDIEHTDIEKFKETFSTELSIIRAKIIGKNKEIPEHDFITQTRSIFRGSNEVFMKHMTKRDLENIIEGIHSYKNTKTNIEQSKANLVKEYNKYVGFISTLMNINYNDDALGATITGKDGTTKSVDIVLVNRHKTYQSLVVSFISQIAEAYSIVFKEKLLAIKDKYEMEMSILSQLIKLV